MTAYPCTCGPHPYVNLTNPYLKYHKIDRNFVDEELDAGVGGVHTDDLNDIRRQVRNACRSHGCFHVSIQYPPSSDRDKSNLPIKCFAKPREEIESDIETLFSPSFLRTALPLTDQNKSTSFDPEEIRNGGMYEVSFSGNDNEDRKTATFRGRSAESGDGSETTAEPKLSWEFQRCKSSFKSLTDSSLKLETKCESREWLHLSEWTEALHSVASTIVNLLNIPSQLVLQERPCNCLQSTNLMTNDSERTGSESYKNKCNIDLLRIFRYDPFPLPVSVLGSSEHSDWGSLTVVWQDSKRGLQTYCYACKKWSDVNPSSTSLSNLVEESNNRSVNLFVHVGDFLSLSTSQGSNTTPEWYSPRHRVLCPVQCSTSSGKNSDHESNCRRSLVYFAYPPPGITLHNAQEVVAPLFTSPRENTNAITTNHILDVYSLLQNQASQELTKQKNIKTSEESVHSFDMLSNLMAYERILNTPFHEVIHEKWCQVQRK